MQRREDERQEDEPREDEYDNERSRQAVAKVLKSVGVPCIPREELEIDKRPMSRGGFCEVRRALWVRDKVDVVVKELVAMSPLHRRYRIALGFARELSVWCTLEHPNILPCLGFNLDIPDGDAYFVSPYISGGSVRARLNEGPLPSAEQRMRWVTDLTEGLNYLHTFKEGDRATPVVHGDLKSNNILINHENRAIICDFGLSSIIKMGESTGLTTSGSFKGAIRWCSPELANDNNRTIYSDVWAWALCVLEILTGRLPYYRQQNDIAVSVRIVQGPPLSRNEYPELPETSAIWDIVEAGLKTEPTSRATVQESLQQLELLRKPDVSSDDNADIFHPISRWLNRMAQYLPPAGGNVSSDPLAQRSMSAPVVSDGPKSRLIVGMDLGMTFSAVSYAYVRPDTNRNPLYSEPRVRDVMFEGHENGLGDTKVPTTLFHDEARDVWYCGAETLGLTDEDKSKLVKFEWFKLQLLSNEVDESHRNMYPNATPVRLFSLFFAYMHKRLQTQFEATEFKGPELWQQIEKNAVYVISHPNDWSSRHQVLLKRALIDARIIGDEDDDRATFVTEGEASLHWWLKEDPQPLSLQNQVVICDAGEETINVFSYAVSQVEPLRVTERRPGDTRNSGAAAVTRSFRDHIKHKLKGSKYEGRDVIDRMVKTFDTSVKRLFHANAQAVQRIEFGYSDDHDEQYDIRYGILSISAELVKSLFEPSCTAAVEAIRNHASPNCYVVLAGGFSGSPWLYHRVSAGLRDMTPHVKRASSQPDKAVARGAVEFYLNSRGTSRIAQRTLGLPLDVPYNSDVQSHVIRQHLVKIDAVSGHRLLPGRFCTLVVKGDIELDASVHRVERIEYVASNRHGYKVVFRLTEYIGRLHNVEFTDMDEASCFRSLGEFKAKIPPMAFRRAESDSVGGRVCWEVRYHIAFDTGPPEKCYVQWVEEGETKQESAVRRTRRIRRR